MLKRYIKSSIGRKQIVAVTGLLLVGFLAFHLAMNISIFWGADAYNFFPNIAHSTGLLLRLLEAGLATLFLTHIIFTAILVIENRKARGRAYAGNQLKKKRSLATRLMPYTGTILLLFLIFHIKDYVLADHVGKAATINGEELGLYGVVVNSFSKNIFRPVAYIIAMFAVGFHLAHGVQSVCQSFGLKSSYTPLVQHLSTGLGLLFAIGFSSIPAYFLIKSLSLSCS